MKNLENYIIDLDDEDRKVLPKWRIKCIELLNYKIKESLMDYHARRFSNNSEGDNLI